MFTPEPVPQGLIDFIQGGAKFLIAGHREPDGDCVGSQLALSSALRRLGKEALPCSAGPFKRIEVIPYQERFLNHLGDSERAGARVIIVDSTGADRTGDLERALKGLPTAVIDHHALGSHDLEDPDTVFYLDRRAPSTTFMIQGLIEALGLTLTEEEAELLFFGLCTDTGFFRHVDAEGAEVFFSAARLIRAGASPKQAFQAINGGKSLGSRILIGTILSRAESYYEGRLLVSYEKLVESQRYGLEGRDSDSLYQLLQSVAGVEAIAIIRQESVENCTIGFRSRDRINVAEIALQFGGGGHKNAAGVQLRGTIEDLKPRVIEAFRNPINT
jgi:phosphoesterase RecJ-like protein